MNNLVIVESPTKARTLAKYLGSQYQIEASMGHIRDLPKSELGIDIEHGFEPKYIIPKDKKKHVGELKKLVERAKELYLATDPDREGEAISWHLKHIFEEDSKFKHIPVHRVTFHEITPEAIQEAFKNPREINLKLVDAQQARRVLDRIVGYKLSPLLWKKIKSGLSAGRVQSVALRLIVEREREIDKFQPVEYWQIEVTLENGQREVFKAQLVEQAGKKLEIHNQTEADTHVTNLNSASYKVAKVVEREVKRQAAPPFTTSTLQQTAGNRLRLSAKRTMMLAQNLYERGLITYMRTDSLNISPGFISATREFIDSSFGKNYLPASARYFKSKSKNAQEAHEAIRPTDIKLSPDKIKTMDGLTRDHVRVYELIWKRMLASQMSEARFLQTTVDVLAKYSNGVILSDNEGSPADAGIDATGTSPEILLRQLADQNDNTYTLRASGSVIQFDGWLKLYGVKQESGSQGEDDATQETGTQILPPLREGEDLKKLKVDPTQHFTEPPPRYTEASLIKKLEELGIGRPSTYAPILSTIQDRYYVEREERKFKPTSLGLAVNDFLVKYFPNIVDFTFTAGMEDELDEISRGERQWRETIAHFYSPFDETLAKVGESAERVKLEVETVDKQCPECGKQLVVRMGRFGKFLACSGFPECKHTEALEEKIDAKCPEDGGEIVVRRTRKGKIFYGCKNWPNCKYASWNKPKTKDNQEPQAVPASS